MAWRRSVFRLLSLALVALVVACKPQPHPAPALPVQPSASAGDEVEVSRFLHAHWARPMPPQGPLPAAMAGQGISLAPDRCAACHRPQFDDWGRSRHSRAMGPGVLGQLLTMAAEARSEHQDCLRCHAPLAEQADSLVAAIENLPGQRLRAAASSDALHEQGLVCAACHVRGNTWYGPPRRDGSQPVGDLSAQPHGGWRASTAFERSQFCAACHQFKDDEYALNGKLLENTFQEWRASRHAREGVSCQSCHMPDRRHLWRGVHDPEMVKQGVGFDAGAVTATNGQLQARFVVSNTGVGHHFPTYVTPRVVVLGVQLDAAGQRLEGTEQAFVIGRQVALDLSREIADTRIPSGERASFDYRAPRHARATALAWEVQVQPDAFYLEFYDSLLRDAPRGPARQLIELARDEARASPYQAHARQLPMP